MPVHAVRCLAPAEFQRVGWRLLKQSGQQQLRNWILPKLVVLLVAYCLLLQSTAAVPVKEIRRVLIFNAQGVSSPGVNLINQEIRAALAKSPFQIELYSEYLETTLFPDDASQRRNRDSYIRRYRDRKPDLIIAVGPSPIKFMVDSHERFFPNIPIVFCASPEKLAGNPKLDSQFAGVWETVEPEKTLEAALQLQPGTKQVVVVGGAGSYDRLVNDFVRDSLRKYEATLELTYLTDLAMPVLLERLKHLPNHTIILYTELEQDAAGTRFIPATQSAPMVAGAANAPVFVMADTLVGQGTIGGYVSSFAAQGQVAAGIATRVLNRERPLDIPIVKGTNLYMFDWRALQRWGFNEGALPPGSTVLYRQPTVWQSYKRYILGVVLLP